MQAAPISAACSVLLCANERLSGMVAYELASAGIPFVFNGQEVYVERMFPLLHYIVAKCARSIESYIDGVDHAEKWLQSYRDQTRAFIAERETTERMVAALMDERRKK